MRTILRYSLLRSRGQILGWGICLALLGAYLVGFYDSLADQQSSLVQLLQSYPKELLAFFGDISQIFTPAGFLHVEFFSYMPLILGIYAVLAGSGLLAGDEENGTLDLVLSYPLRRRDLFLGRLIGFLLAVLGILFLTWVGFVIALPASKKLDFSLSSLALPFLSLFAELALFGALALMLSMLLPSRKMAALTAGLLLVASFFITSLASLDENLERISNFSPLNYYQGGNAILGLNWSWFLGLLGVALLCTLLASWRFERREIRVGGEGSWSFPTKITGMVRLKKTST